MAPMIDLWLDRRGDAIAPCWGQMDFTDFRGWHANLVLSRFEDEEPDPRLILIGGVFAELTGQYPKDSRMSERAPTLFKTVLAEHFRRIRTEGLIGLVQNQVMVKRRDHLDMQLIELPFRDGGDNIERLVHVVREVPR